MRGLTLGELFSNLPPPLEYPPPLGGSLRDPSGIQVVRVLLALPAEEDVVQRLDWLGIFKNVSWR
jgi:hypothetical protein